MGLRLGRSRRWTRKTKKDIAKCEVEQMPLSFAELRKADNIQVLQDLLSDILKHVQGLVNLGFGHAEIETGSSPWAGNCSATLCRYVSSVAREDNIAGGWERLLRDAQERNTLLTAIIMKILDEEVISSLLFGASSSHSNMLRAQDKSLGHVEGFRRTMLRSHTNLEFLSSGNGVPPLFWQQVDQLTAKTLNMLLPIYNAVGQAKPDQPMPLPWIYEKLHGAIALAGAFNYATRTYPIIIDSVWAIPGDALELDQLDICPQILEQSVVKADLHDTLQYKNLLAPRRAKVKISVAPRITGYVMESKDRMISFRLLQPRAAFYYGYQEGAWDKEEASVPLEKHVGKVTPARGTVPVVILLILAAFAWSDSFKDWVDRLNEYIGVVLTYLVPQRRVHWGPMEPPNNTIGDLDLSFIVAQVNPTPTISATVLTIVDMEKPAFTLEHVDDDSKVSASTSTVEPPSTLHVVSVDTHGEDGQGTEMTHEDKTSITTQLRRPQTIT